MSSYLITGTSRGLGLEFVRELVRQGPSSARLILATSRGQQVPAALQKVIDEAPDRVKHVPLEVTNQASIDQAVKLANEMLGSSGLDVLVNNAGINNPEGRTEKMSSENLLTVFSTNVVAVHNVIQGFMPLLEAGKGKKIVNISSTMGSIAMNVGFDFFKNIPTAAYNVSKAALNSLTAQYTIDLKDKGFTVFSISPGHLKTDLGGEGAPLTADVGAKAVLKIIQEAKPEDSGRFRNIFVEDDAMHDGKDAPW